jgi:hypothetical protein
MLLAFVSDTHRTRQEENNDPTQSFISLPYVLVVTLFLTLILSSSQPNLTHQDTQTCTHNS